jgi:hypothetical protein
MRKLYEATGGQPQRWKSLGNLGVVKADAAGIAYAIKKGWLIGVGEPPSVMMRWRSNRLLPCSVSGFLNMLAKTPTTRLYKLAWLLLGGTLCGTVNRPGFSGSCFA